MAGNMGRQQSSGNGGYSGGGVNDTGGYSAGGGASQGSAPSGQRAAPTGTGLDAQSTGEEAWNKSLGGIFGKNAQHISVGPAWSGTYDPSALNGVSSQVQAQMNALASPTAQAAAGYGGAQLDQSGQGQWANMQNALAQQEMAVASGQAPSAAEIALKQSQDRNLSNIMAAGQANAGPNSGASRRETLYALGDANAQAQGQMAATRATEQERAMGIAGQLAGQARGQEFQNAATQAGYTQQAGMQGAEFNQQAAMLNPQLQQQTQALQAQYMQMYQQGQISSQELQMKMQELNSQAYSSQMAASVDAAKANMQSQQDANKGIIERLIS